MIDANPRTSAGKQTKAAENKARSLINMKPSEAVRYNERRFMEIALIQ